MATLTSKQGSEYILLVWLLFCAFLDFNASKSFCLSVCLRHAGIVTKQLNFITSH